MSVLIRRIRAFIARVWGSLPPAFDEAYAVKDADSDIEIRENQAGFIECVECPMDGFFATWTEEDMVAHIRAHKEAGHRVPPTVIPNLLGR